MKVGYYDSSYPYKRNIINLVPDIDYVKISDINKILRYTFVLTNKILLNRPIIDTFDLNFIFNDFGLNPVDIMHFFNTVSLSQTPWITTFETIIPRLRSTISLDKNLIKYDKKVVKSLEALASNSCKKIIAISECNLSMQQDFLKYFPQNFSSAIKHKLICLHPPQKTIVDNFEGKQLSLDGQIHFMFVGGDFFRKGGMEILEAFHESRKNNGYNFKLTIVSSLTIDSYVTKKTEKDVKLAKKFISENSEWIDYFNYLPNYQVIELMKSAHIGLLPTYADTYGYSVLEFQASGCPVISTNVRALPEINNNEIGWIIEIPKNPSGEAIRKTQEDRDKISQLIKHGLTNLISEIMENSNIIILKANASLKHIKDEHSPKKYSRKLKEIYSYALQ